MLWRHQSKIPSPSPTITLKCWCQKVAVQFTVIIRLISIFSGPSKVFVQYQVSCSKSEKMEHTNELELQWKRCWTPPGEFPDLDPTRAEMGENAVFSILLHHHSWGFACNPHPASLDTQKHAQLHAGQFCQLQMLLSHQRKQHCHCSCCKREHQQKPTVDANPGYPHKLHQAQFYTAPVWFKTSRGLISWEKMYKCVAIIIFKVTDLCWHVALRRRRWSQCRHWEQDFLRGEK